MDDGARRALSKINEITPRKKGDGCARGRSIRNSAAGVETKTPAFRARQMVNRRMKGDADWSFVGRNVAERLALSNNCTFVCYDAW